MRLLIFAAGAILPLMVVLAIALFNGTFDKLWFWTFKYSAAYAGAVPLSRGMENLYKSLVEVTDGFALWWIMAASGFLILVIDEWFKKIRWTIVSFTLSSLLAVSIGLYFRNHYYILLLPAAAMLVGILIDSLHYYISRKCSYKVAISLPVIFFLFVIILGLKVHQDYFLLEKPETLVKSIHGPNPFLESLKIGEFLRSRTISVRLSQG